MQLLAMNVQGDILLLISQTRIIQIRKKMANTLTSDKISQIQETLNCLALQAKYSPQREKEGFCYTYKSSPMILSDSYDSFQKELFENQVKILKETAEYCPNFDEVVESVSTHQSNIYNILLPFTFNKMCPTKKEITVQETLDSLLNYSAMSCTVNEIRQLQIRDKKAACNTFESIFYNKETFETDNFYKSDFAQSINNLIFQCKPALTPYNDNIYEGKMLLAGISTLCDIDIPPLRENFERLEQLFGEVDTPEQV